MIIQRLSLTGVRSFAGNPLLLGSANEYHLSNDQSLLNWPHSRMESDAAEAEAEVEAIIFD